MAITFVAGASGASEDSPTTTGTMDSTGADCLVVLVASLEGGAAPVVTDSKSNTWSTAEVIALDFDSVVRLSLFVCLPTSVGSGHTVTVTQASGILSVSTLAFAGVIQTTPFEASVDANSENSVTSFQAGTVTPTEDGRLFIAALAHSEGGSSGMAINESFTLTHEIYYSAADGDRHLGLFSAYRIQTTAAGLNPTWSWSGASLSVALLGTLIPAAAAPATLGDLTVWAMGQPPGLNKSGSEPAAPGSGELRAWRGSLNTWHRSSS